MDQIQFLLANNTTFPICKYSSNTNKQKILWGTAEMSKVEKCFGMTNTLPCLRPKQPNLNTPLSSPKGSATSQKSSPIKQMDEMDEMEAVNSSTKYNSPRIPPNLKTQPTYETPVRNKKQKTLTKNEMEMDAPQEILDDSDPISPIHETVTLISSFNKSQTIDPLKWEIFMKRLLKQRELSFEITEKDIMLKHLDEQTQAEMKIAMLTVNKDIINRIQKKRLQTMVRR